MLVKFPHSFADGVGLMSTALALSDNYDKKELFETAPLYSWGRKLLFVLNSPIWVGWMALYP